MNELERGLYRLTKLKKFLDDLRTMKRSTMLRNFAAIQRNAEPYSEMLEQGIEHLNTMKKRRDDALPTLRTRD
jgi:hypothetical protein